MSLLSNIGFPPSGLPRSDIHYLDSDAFLFPGIVESRIAGVAPPDADHFVGASDPNAPVNLGWLMIRKGQRARQHLSSAPRTEEGRQRAYEEWRDTVIPENPPVQSR